MKVTCHCGHDFEAKHPTAKSCSARCRKRASRAGVQLVPAPRVESDDEPDLEPPAPRATLKPPPPAPVPSAFEEATREELERIGQADSMLGLQVLIIARRMSGGGETGSALTTLSKEHSRLMGALGAGAKQADPLDEVSRRREEKLARATAG